MAERARKVTLVPEAGSEPWSHVVPHPYRVVAYEDRARDHMLTLRWWRVDPIKGGQWRRETLGKKLERDRRGEPLAELTAFAITKAMEKALVLAGQRPEPAKPDAPARPLAIGDAWAILTDKEIGKYRVDSEHRREIRRALDFAELVWGRDRAWASLEDDDWMRLMRRRFEGLVARGKSGVRRTEITVSRLDTVARYLRGKKRLAADAAHPPVDWREQLQADWRELHRSRKNYAPAQPRHTLDEMRRLLIASADGDPRFHALFQLAAEYRLGQAVRAMRSDLELDEAQTFTIQGAGKKKGEIVALTPAQVKVARAYLTGLLAALEELYRTGEISDYPLFPSGRLRTKKGVFKLGRTMDPRSKRAEPLTPASREWVIKQFIATERRAKVKHVPGRAAYGVRRINVDEALESGISPRGLMAAGGWSDPKIPTTVYAEKENRAGRREAMRTRMQIRGEKPTADTPEQTPGPAEADHA